MSVFGGRVDNRKRGLTLRYTCGNDLVRGPSSVFTRHLRTEGGAADIILYEGDADSPAVDIEIRSPVFYVNRGELNPGKM